MNTGVLIKLLTLVEMGFELSVLKKQIQEKEASGATPGEITNYIDGLYEEAFKELTETE
jgi:hypothetical protein